MEKILIYLTKEQRNELKEKSNKLGSSMGSIIRMALNEYFEGKNE